MFTPINSAFSPKGAALCCEQVSLEAIADSVGTPFYVYSLNRVRTNYRRLAAAFAPLNPALHYSLKANANLTLIRTLLPEGASLDAVSGGEIFRGLAAGADPRQIVFAGVGKTAAELTYALEQGVGCFNVESDQELARLNALAATHNTRATVALRLNPDVKAHTHHYIATGHAAAKFGISLATARTLLTNAGQYPNLNITGLHVHIGSQLESVAETVEAARYALAIVNDFSALNHLNLGGGFPVTYNDEQYPTVEEFAAELIPLLTRPGLSIGFEPGRYIVADAGALVAEVQYIKQVDGQRIIVTDTGMTELIRPALYGARHPIRALTPHGAESEAQVVGPICESADVLHPAALLPELLPGDRVAILMAGAYGAVMGSNYNARPRPPEIVVDGDQWTIARRRETWNDLIALER